MVKYVFNHLERIYIGMNTPGRIKFCRYDWDFNKGLLLAMKHRAEEGGRHLASRRAKLTRG